MYSNPLVMPPAVSEMLTPTLNSMGVMTSWLDPYTEEFVRFAPLAPGPSLDIGAAYGIATLAALETGADVIACDPEQRHLDICAQRTPFDRHSHLTLLKGALPHEIKLENDSIGAIICSRVLHFLTAEDIEASLENMFRWLHPGGKIYLIADTPYNRTLKKFIPTYEKRKNEGITWPGEIQNFPTFMPTELASNLPNFFHTLDPDILSRACIQAGFIVEKAGFIARIDYLADVQDDGREGVGVIAYKSLSLNHEI
jgi:SAM-dependent methyltransferase